MQKDPLKEKSTVLAMKVIHLQKRIQSEKNEYLISRKLFHAATNTGALIREISISYSDKEYVENFSKARKSCYETLYWLELLFKSKLIEKQEYEQLNLLTLELVKMITSSIKTKKKNIRN